MDKQHPDSIEVYKRLLSYVKRYYLIFIVAIVSTIIYSAVDAYLVKLIGPIVDDGLVANDPLKVKPILFLMLLIFFVRGCANFLSTYSMAWIARKVVVTLRQKLFAHMQKLPAYFYDTHHSGELLSKLSFNVEQVAKASTSVISDAIRSTFLAVFLIGVMFYTNWQLTSIFLIAGPIIAYLFKFASRRFRSISHRIQGTMANVTKVAEENIEAYKVVRVFNGQAHEIKQFNDVTTRNRHLEMKMVITEAISTPLIQCVGGSALVLTLYLALTDGVPIEVSPGDFVTLLVAMITLLNPIKQLTAISSKIQSGLAGAESIFDLMDEPAEPDHGTQTLVRAQGKIVYHNVSFGYKTKPGNVLKDINLEVNAGETVALVGHSGGGKTSIVNLLTRFYTEYTGEIKLDNINILDLTLHDLRNQITLVSQNVTLFHDTVASNIAYGDDNIDQNKLLAAARAAYAMPFIEVLPEGFDTMVGENGILLSGGQRQRIAIARALYKDSPILILDEATSALDVEAERLIQAAFDTVMKGRTTLVIAHRLSTIKKADKIVVIKKGQIVEIGKHESLLRKDGYYKQLYHMQYRDIEAPESNYGT